MIILTIRTDKPQAEIGLYDDLEELVYEKWEAHRQLAETLHNKIAKMLKPSGKRLQDIEGLICFSGPGSFTGLRIGLSVGNAIAYGLDVPIVAGGGKIWIKNGIGRLKSGDNDKIAIPKYGAPVNITQPKK